MKIVVLTGSPREKGASFALTERFIEGAKSAGHMVERFDAADLKLHPCRACGYCRRMDEQCIQKDAMEEIKPAVKNADAVVFVTPTYYFGICAQLKMVIDRFYAFGNSIKNTGKKSALIVTSASEGEHITAGIRENYHGICEFLGLENRGEIYAQGVANREDLDNTGYLGQAYKLGMEM